MVPAPGTTIDDPVGPDHLPDLVRSQQDITEYLHSSNAYELMEYLLKELVTEQPLDPLDHMITCLQTEHPLGPLRVIVSSPPCMGRDALAKRLADSFGLVYIGAGDLLRDQGVETEKLDFADENEVSELVVERLQEAHSSMQGWVLDGFPRTRVQTSFLKERSIVPTHILALKASTEWILQRNDKIANGELEGTYVHPDALEDKIRVYTCHCSSTFETYNNKIVPVDMELGEEGDWAAAEKAVRKLPRSKGPKLPPRVILLGPRGIGIREHASRLAARLGAVFLDGEKLADADSHDNKESSTSAVRERLEKLDCTKDGWVLCNFPATTEKARDISKDPSLEPTRVVCLMPSAETCVERLRHRLVDTVTGMMWTTPPRNPNVRKRLVRRTQDQPQAVLAAHTAFCEQIPQILQAFGNDGKCVSIPADESPEKVFHEVVEFVERPLPRPPVQ